MKILLPISLFILLSTFGQSQELVFEKEMELSETSEMFPIFSPSKDEFPILIKDNNSLRLIVFDENMESVLEVQTDFHGRLFSNFIGNVMMGKMNYLYFLHENGKAILILVINIETKEITSKQIEFEKPRDRFVAAFSDTSRLIFITSVKRNSRIKVRFLEGAEIHSSKEYDFSGIAFSTTYHLYKLDDLLIPRKSFGKIDSFRPVNIRGAANKSKIYFKDNQIIISLDVYNKKTRLLLLNLENNLAQKIDIVHPETSQNMYEKSNSFIYENNLYQFVSGKKEWAISQVDYLSDSSRKTIRLNSADLMSFTNSEAYIVHTNSGFAVVDKTKPFESKKFYNKISRLDPFIFVSNEYNDTLEFIIGGFSYIGGAEYNLIGPMISTSGGGYMSSGSTYFPGNFSSVYFISTFNNQTFAHIPEKSGGGCSTKVYIYLKILKKETNEQNELTYYTNHFFAERVFRHNNKCFLGYYLREDKKYYLYRFGDIMKE